MFPNADGLDALRLQGGGLPVADAVSSQFRLPIGAIILRYDKMLRAFVEEASVGEQGKVQSWHPPVRLAGQILGMLDQFLVREHQAWL